MDYHTVVVGAGMMGSSAAYSLSKAGVSTLLIDQFPIPHNRGSSGGHSRIIRQANYAEEELTPLMEESIKLWENLEKESGVSLIKPVPLLCAVSDRDEKLRKSKNALIESIQKVSDSPVLTANQANQIYGTNFDLDAEVIVDKTAGIMKADLCIATLQKLFIKYGGTIRGNTKVENIIPKDDSSEIKLVTTSDVIKCKSIVICAGPWASPLLANIGLNLPPMEVVKVGVYYWQTKNPLKSDYIVIDQTDHNKFYYLPPMEYDGLGKAAFHGGPRVFPDLRDLTNLDKVKKMCEKWVVKTMPGLHPVPVIEESCLYTITPDWSFIIDVHPQYKNVVYACGFSGSGFKLGPTCGEELANLALGNKMSKKFEYYTAERFQKKSKL